MRRERPGHAAPSAALACAFVCCAVVLCACSVTGAKKTAANPAPTDRHPQENPLLPVLDLMTDLGEADPARQAELFQNVKDAAELAPTTANKLRYALALSVPGHNGSDEVAAQRQLSELLARPDTLLPSERLLAQVQLKDVETRLTIEGDAKRIRDDPNRDGHAEKLLAANRKLAAEMDENARLRKALDDARAKLDAVTHIERSINDRGSASAPAATGATPASP
jgi:hypothetical protein